MIIAKNLTKEFERTVLREGKGKKKRHGKETFAAVDHVSFSVKQGEIVGVLGPNGAGKTTLLRMLASLMEPTEGYVGITKREEECEDFADLPKEQLITDPIELKSSIGYLSGNTKLYHRMSPREMLGMMAKLYGIPDNKAKERMEEIFRVLSMEEFADNRIEKLSTGQTQRTSIARCLIHAPSVYIFDEPTLGLDILSADAIVRFMKEEKEKGKTVLYSTHYLEEAELLCDRLLLIWQGRMIKEGTPEKIMKETGTDNLRDAFHCIMKGAEE